MKEKKLLNIRRILSILEIPVDIAVLALGIQLLASPSATGEYSAVSIFALFAFSCALCSIVTGKQDRLAFIRYIVYTPSSKSAVKISPSGFTINLVKHIKN